MITTDEQFILTRKHVWRYSLIAVCLRLLPIILAIPFYHLLFVKFFVFFCLYLALVQAISLISRRDPAILVRIDMHGIMFYEYRDLKLRYKVFYSWEEINSYCVRKWTTKKAREMAIRYTLSGETMIILHLKNGCRHYYNLSDSMCYSRDESILLRIILIAKIYRFSKGSVKWFILPDKYDKFTLK